MKMMVSIYKTTRKQGVYLYIDKQAGVKTIPESLHKLMGPHPQHVLDLLLTPDRRLAEADSTEVLNKIREKGYYLQLPPAESFGDESNI